MSVRLQSVTTPIHPIGVLKGACKKKDNKDNTNKPIQPIWPAWYKQGNNL